MAKKRTAWAHLPNAKLIDAVLADVKARPDVWVTAWIATLEGTARESRAGHPLTPAVIEAWRAAQAVTLAAIKAATQRAARDKVWVTAPGAEWEAVSVAARLAAQGAAQGAVRTAELITPRHRSWHRAMDAVIKPLRESAAFGAASPCIALTVWDDCAHLLDLPSTTLREIVNAGKPPACHQAVLLLPYVLVKENVQEPRRQVTPA